MELVGATLGRDLKMGAAETSILSIVCVGHNLDAFHGIFRRSDNGRAAPDGAYGADAVNRDAVVLRLLPIGNNLHAIFRFEDAVSATRAAAVSLRAGEGVTSRLKEGRC